MRGSKIKFKARNQYKSFSVNPLREMEAQLTDCWSCKNCWNHFAIGDGSVVVYLLWDLGEKELSAAESWCLPTEDSAWEGPGRSGSYWQSLKKIKRIHTLSTLSSILSHICNGLNQRQTRPQQRLNYQQYISLSNSQRWRKSHSSGEAFLLKLHASKPHGIIRFFQ